MRLVAKVAHGKLPGHRMVQMVFVTGPATCEASGSMVLRRALRWFRTRLGLGW
jgi:hypothetical protein